MPVHGASPPKCARALLQFARRARAAVALVGLVGLIALIAAPAASASTDEYSVPEGFFGIGAPTFGVLSYSDHEALDRHAGRIEAAGLDWVRAPLPWHAREPVAPQDGAHSYRWATTDNLVRALARHGLRLMPLLFEAPRWAQDPVVRELCTQGGGEVAADHVNDFASFTAALAARYGRGGSFWSHNPELPYWPVERYEIWNEPNRWSWCPGPNPERFAELYAASRDALHGVDPEAIAVMGGFSAYREDVLQGGRLVVMDLADFVTRMIAHRPSLAGEVDAVAIHPYQPDPAQMISFLGWFRERLSAAGLGGVPMMITEFGWHTSGEPGAVPEDERAARFRWLLDRLPRTNCNVIGIAPHAWAKAESDPADPEDWFGIADPVSGDLHPSGQAYAEKVELFEGRGSVPPPSEVIHACGGAPPPESVGTPPPETGGEPPSGSDGSAPHSGGGAVGSPAPAAADSNVAADTTPAAADTTAPTVVIRGGPRGSTGSRGAVFRIRASDDGGVRGVRCRLDGARWQRCGGRLRVGRLTAGRHRLRAVALDATGNRGRAVRSFRVPGR